MTDKDKKLAREILNKRSSDTLNGLYHYDSLFELMQAYHEAKLRESKIVESFERENQYVSDEDIEAFATLQSNPESKKDFERGLWLGIKVGAKAMQNGEIKHNG